jgi:hypothetical protein
MFTKNLARAALAIALVLGTAHAQSMSAPASSTPAAEHNDGERWGGHFGVGYYGQQTLGFIGDNGGAGVPPGSTTLHFVGARYWLSQGNAGLVKGIGVDVAVGLALDSSSAETDTGTGTTNIDLPGAGGFGLRAGMPLALYSAKHATFQVSPEFTFAMGGSNLKGDAAQGTVDMDRSSTSFGLGARAGVEVFFGFIGMPQLALDATVGLGVDYRSQTFSTEVAGVKTSATNSEFSLSTTDGEKPWEVFTNGIIRARYYF